MTKDRTLFIAGVGAILAAGFLVGYLFGGQTVDPSPELKKQLEQSEARAIVAKDSVQRLLKRVSQSDLETAQLWQLYLAALSDKDSIRIEYAPLYPRIAGADARLLRHLSDSLRSKFLLNASRYRALLDTGGASFNRDTAGHGLLHDR